MDIHLTPINTPLKLESMGKIFVQPPKDFVTYILKGNKQDFRIGVNSTYNLISATKNMHSTSLNPRIIDKCIKQESEAGNIIGVFPKALAPNVHIN